MTASARDSTAASHDSTASARDSIVALVTATSPRLGGTRLVCLDGPAGSGKTTLAAWLAADWTSEQLGHDVVHLDDLYDGWSALTGDRARDLTARVADGVLAPLATGRPGSYRRYDWPTARFAETHTVAPVDVLVLEGCACAQAAWADRTAVAVWVEAPSALRTARWLARDDDERAARQCRDWQRDEDAWFAADRTRSRADLVVDGTTGLVTTGRVTPNWSRDVDPGAPVGDRPAIDAGMTESS